METQLKIISKREAHDMIDKVPGKKIMILTYNDKMGISKHGAFVKKKIGKKYVDKATILILSENKLVRTLNLQGRLLNGFLFYRRKNTSKVILLEK